MMMVYDDDDDGDDEEGHDGHDDDADDSDVIMSDEVYENSVCLHLVAVEPL